VDLTDSDEETIKEKYKGKEKIGEKKEKERTGEKHKAPQDDLNSHKRTKEKSHKQPIDGQLGMDDYENIASHIQESLEPPMTVLVSSQTAMKRALDMQIVELNTLMERASQLTPQNLSSSSSQ